MTPNTDSVAVLRQIAHEMRTRYALPTGHGAVYGVVANNAVDVAAMLLNWAGRVGAAATALEAQASAPGGEVTEALRAVLPYVATTAVGCHGDKCREPWCYSCFGEEAADEAASKAREAYHAAHAALAARTGKGE